MKKLSNQGFTHHFLMAFVIVAVAVAGVYHLVRSHAATATNGQIAYHSNVNSNVVSVMNPDGTGSRTFIDNGYYTRDISWSRDGRKMVYSTELGNTNSGDQIDIGYSNGTHIAQLTGGSHIDTKPQLSPDGKQILFERSYVTSTTATSTNYARALYVMNVNGSNEHQITPQDGSTRSQGVWSPDGLRILFYYSVPGVGETWNMMNPDGTNVTPVANDLDNSIAKFSPDGTKLLFAGTDRNTHNCVLRTTDLTGQNKTMVFTSNGSCGWNGGLDWSPDGRKLVFGYLADRSYSYIYTINIDGSALTKLTTAPADSPSWQPNTQTASASWSRPGATAITYGIPGDIPVPADYNGDGKADIAVFRPSNGTWYVNGIKVVQFGVAGDIPVPADYNGDGKADIAVYRPHEAKWYIQGVGTYVYGARGALPMPADYNGDGKADLGYYIPTTFTWSASYIMNSSVLYPLLRDVPYGAVGDIPTPGRYLTDTKATPAVFRPSNGTWYLYGLTAIQYGQTGDIPVPADYNGDTKTDVAVYRPSNSTWYVRSIAVTQFGAINDYPVSADYTGDKKADLSIFRL